VVPGPGPAHLATLPAGALLPAGAQCASWVRAAAPLPETKRVNLVANATPGHGLGADGRPGQCPQSFGVLQDRYPFLHSSWPGIATSTAMSADTAYAVWRSCFEGYERWLGTVDRGQPYAAGDAWGCIGRWVSGRWHTAPAERYIASVRGLLGRRVWEQPDFRELA